MPYLREFGMLSSSSSLRRAGILVAAVELAKLCEAHLLLGETARQVHFRHRVGSSTNATTAAGIITSVAASAICLLFSPVCFAIRFSFRSKVPAALINASEGGRRRRAKERLL